MQDGILQILPASGLVEALTQHLTPFVKICGRTPDSDSGALRGLVDAGGLSGGLAARRAGPLLPNRLLLSR